jgi:hypothetical protein
LSHHGRADFPPSSYISSLKIFDGSALRSGLWSLDLTTGRWTRVAGDCIEGSCPVPGTASVLFASILETFYIVLPGGAAPGAPRIDDFDAGKPADYFAREDADAATADAEKIIVWVEERVRGPQQGEGGFPCQVAPRQRYPRCRADV